MRNSVKKGLFAVLFFASFSLLLPSETFAQCASGPSLVVTAENTIVNTYYPGTASVAAGARSIVLGTSRGASTAISPGNTVLIIQMQGSPINSTNTDSYGDGVAGSPGAGELGASALSSTGVWEYGYAVNTVPVGGGTLQLALPLKHAFTNANPTATSNVYRYQVIRVPQYSTLDFSFIGIIAGTITGSVWNGTTGGLLLMMPER